MEWYGSLDAMQGRQLPRKWNPVVLHVLREMWLLSLPGKAITRLQWAAAFGITWGSKLP